MGGSFALTDRLSLSPTAILTSARYTNVSGRVELDDEGNEAIIAESGNGGGIVQLNLYTLYRDVFVDGLDVGFGVFNVLNRRIDFLQPYDTAHAPLPGPAREFLLKLSYRIGLTGR